MPPTYGTDPNPESCFNLLPESQESQESVTSIADTPRRNALFVPPSYSLIHPSNKYSPIRRPMELHKLKTDHPCLHPLIGTFVVATLDSEAILARIDKVLVDEGEICYKLRLMAKHGHGLSNNIYFNFVSSAHEEREFAFVDHTTVFAYLATEPVMINGNFILKSSDRANFITLCNMCTVSSNVEAQ